MYFTYEELFWCCFSWRVSTEFTERNYFGLSSWGTSLHPLKGLKVPPATGRASRSTGNFWQFMDIFARCFYAIQWNISHWVIHITTMGGKRRNWNISHVVIDKGRQRPFLRALVSPSHYLSLIYYQIRDRRALVTIQSRPIALQRRKLT